MDNFFPRFSPLSNICCFVRRFRGFLADSGKTGSGISSLSERVGDLATGVAEARGSGRVLGVGLKYQIKNSNFIEML